MDFPCKNLSVLILARLHRTLVHLGADVVSQTRCSIAGVVGALLPCAMGGRLRVTDTCAHISAAGLLVASWNTRGWLGSAGPAHDSRGKKHRCVQRLCELNENVCLQETRERLEF